MIAEANLFGPDILIVVLIIAVIFGGSKLPELGKGLGQGMRQFKDAMRSVTEPDAKTEDK